MASFTQGPDIVVDPSLTQATVSWTADMDSYGQVDFGLNPTNLDQSLQDLNFGPDHTVLLTGLQSGQVYTCVVSILDSNGAVVLSSANLTFSTTAAPAPVIVTGPVADPAIDSAEISWGCNVSGTGLVKMGENQATLNLVFTDSTISTDHSIAPQGLKPGCQYFYNVANVDPNTGSVLVQSTNLSFTTQPVVTGAALRFPIAFPWLVRKGHTSTFSVFVVKAGKPVANDPVTFQVLSGSGSFAGAPSVTVNSNTFGKAVTLFTAGYQRGLVRVQISAQGAANKVILHCFIL
jgi:hypothetical protein